MDTEIRNDTLWNVGMIYLGRLGIEVCKRAEGILGGHMGKGGLQDRTELGSWDTEEEEGLSELGVLPDTLAGYCGIVLHIVAYH